MREFIITGIRKGGKTSEVISGPEVPHAEQNAKYKTLAASGELGDFSEIHLWSSTGGKVRKHRFTRKGGVNLDAALTPKEQSAKAAAAREEKKRAQREAAEAKAAAAKAKQAASKPQDPNSSEIKTPVSPSADTPSTPPAAETPQEGDTSSTENQS